MQAAEQGDTARGASGLPPWRSAPTQQLDTIDADARYHAAVIRLQVGDFAGAHALADTILEQSPDHLFGYVVRGDAAELADDPGALQPGPAGFPAPITTGRWRPGGSEYRDHEPVIEEFKERGGKAVRR